MTIGYCVKCRGKREIGSPAPYTMKNGKPAIKGTCPACSTAILELVEDKKFNTKFISANHQQGHAIAKAMAMDLFLFLV